MRPEHPLRLTGRRQGECVTEQVNEAAADPIAACPWCGPGSRLALRGDGAGGQALWCTHCGCKGPTVSLSGQDFAEADEQTKVRWSARADRRRTALREAIDRIRGEIALHQLMYGKSMPPGSAISVAYQDLSALLGVVTH